MSVSSTSPTRKSMLLAVTLHFATSKCVIICLQHSSFLWPLKIEVLYSFEKVHAHFHNNSFPICITKQLWGNACAGDRNMFFPVKIFKYKHISCFYHVICMDKYKLTCYKIGSNVGFSKKKDPRIPLFSFSLLLFCNSTCVQLQLLEGAEFKQCEFYRTSCVGISTVKGKLKSFC